MKKQYIRPESQLFVINLEENIASSSSLGESEMSGTSVIKFTHGENGCRGYYTGIVHVWVASAGEAKIDNADDFVVFVEKDVAEI